MVSDPLRPFSYFGGKLSHLDFILPRLPHTERYVEPFGGSAAVLLNRKQSPVETYNDLDGNVVNFFEVLRDRPDELIRKLKLTPYSRKVHLESDELNEDMDDLERARLFFVRITQGYNLQSDGGSGWSFAKGRSSAGMSVEIAKVKSYESDLMDVADRLSQVQIEQWPATKVIENHDHPNTLFYCDPPYVPDTRSGGNYAQEMTAEDHEDLAEKLLECEGKVAFSNYDCDLLRDLYDGWNFETADERMLLSSSGASSKSEILITNYDTSKVTHIEGKPAQEVEW